MPDKITNDSGGDRQELPDVTVTDDPPERQRSIAALDESFRRLSRDMGPRNWSREDIYDRERRARETCLGS